MMSSTIDDIRARLAATGFYQEGLSAAGGLLWKGDIRETALYLLIGNDPSVNLKLNGVSYITAMTWCFKMALLHVENGPSHGSRG